MSDPIVDPVPDQEPFYIIGIGTSAGGLETLRKFFDNIPPGLGHAFVIIQHLSPDYKSLMSELLAHNTSMPIHEVKDGMKVEKGNVYLIPPKKNLTIQGGVLELDDKPPREKLNLPIDIFFKSLALDQRDKAIGIILSGTGSDGSQGLRYINDKDGFVMVESPETAKFDGMPRSAIATGLADSVKPAQELAEELVRILSAPDNRLRGAEKEILRNEDIIQRILFLVERKTDIDFSQYKMPTIARRISRRMMLLNTHKVSDYLNYLYENSNEIQLLYKDLLIGVTRFFRDIASFQRLAEKVIPSIVDSKSDGDAVKIWIPGCSTGEEAYSVAILFREYIEQAKRTLTVKIFATDIEKESLEKASKGVYPEVIAADISQKRLQDFFVHKDNQYRVGTDTRKMLIFSQHNILKDPPFTKVDFVSCRNLLIYFKADVQQYVLSSLHYALNRNGYLFLGSSETLGDLQRHFEEVDRHHHIYRNTDPVARLSHSALNYQDAMRHRAATAPSVQKPRTQDHRFNEIVRDTLHDEMHAASLLVNDNFEVLNADGNYKRYVDLPSDRFSINLLKMVPSNLATVLSSVIRKATKEKQKVHFKGYKLRENEKTHLIDIVVRPFGLGESRSGLFLILFLQRGMQEVGEIVMTSDEKGTHHDARISDLETELKDTKENLQATLEEVETSNEELQASNEELLASNEELQSTNEELQSLNEELHTVNAEYQIKIRELAELNNDIENLLKSTNIGTIFLNRDMHIRKFTPSIDEQFNLVDGDVGRPIENFTNKLSNISNQGIVKDSLKVMDSGEAIAREARMEDGSWYLMRLHPFIDERGSTDGVVITFTNISELKKAKRDIELLEEKWRSILDQSPNVVFTTDTRGRCTFINRVASDNGRKSLTGKGVITFAARADRKRLAKAIKQTLENEHATQVEVHGATDGKYYNVNISPHRVNEKLVGLVCEATDISYRKKAEEEREAMIHNLELAQKMAKMGYYEIMLNDGVCTTSSNFRTMVGIRKKRITLDAYHQLAHPDDRKGMLAAFKKAIAEKHNFNAEYRIVTPGRQLVHVRNRGYLQFDEKDRAIKLVGLLQNITPMKLIQNEILLINELALGISNARDFDHALEVLLSKICVYNDWEYGEVWMPDRKGTALQCSSIYYGKLKKYRKFAVSRKRAAQVPLDAGLQGKIWSMKRPVWFPELARLKEARFPEKDLAAQMNFSAAFGFPVNTGMGILGIFIFYNNIRIEKVENLVRLTGIITSQIGSILHRKHGEQLLLLKESEEWMRKILEAAPTGIVLTDAESTIQQVNGQVEEIFGYSRDALLNKKLNGLLEKGYESLFQVENNGDTAGVDNRNILAGGENIANRQDGQRLPVEVSLNKLSFKNRSYFLASITNISQRKRAEALIKASESKYIDLYERSPDMLVSIDPLSGRIIDCNETTEKDTGYKKQDIAGMPVIDLYDASCRDLAASLHKGFARGISADQSELLLKRRDGTTLDVLVNARAIPDNNGGISQVRLSLRDISALKMARSELEKTLKQLGRTNKELEQFAYVASHDLKAPIANLSSLLYLLELEKGINEQGRLIFDKAVASIDQMNNTIKTLNEVLSLKRNFSLESEKIEFHTILELVKSGIEEQIKGTGTTIKADFSKCETVVFPALHLQNIFQNLITNAIKYRRQEVPPVIELHTTLNSHYTVLSVKDNGTGIDLQRQGMKLFGLFKRFHMHTEGKGIGLYITKSIIENYQGKIEVQSTPGVGTTFYLYFSNNPEPG
jgi:two-component system CheB/CheR fusion protein